LKKNSSGIALRGTEVKSIRGGHAQISDAFARVEKGSLVVQRAHRSVRIRTTSNHDARRQRKLLLNRSEIRKIAQALDAGRSWCRCAFISRSRW